MAITSAAVEGQSPYEHEARQEFGKKDFVVEYEQVIRGKVTVRAESAAQASDDFNLQAEGQVALKITNVRQL